MWIKLKTVLVCLIVVAGLAVVVDTAFALQETEEAISEASPTESVESIPEEPGDLESITAAIKDELQTNINIVWTCVAAFLVFFMQRRGSRAPRTR